MWIVTEYEEDPTIAATTTTTDIITPSSSSTDASTARASAAASSVSQSGAAKVVNNDDGVMIESNVTAANTSGAAVGREYHIRWATTTSTVVDTPPVLQVVESINRKTNATQTQSSSSSSFPLSEWLLVNPYLRIRKVFTNLLLPIGYPHTVRTGYIQYQIYDSIQGLCSYLRGVLCHAAVLEAVGVGDAAATAWGAALTWAYKDGIAMTGGLFYSYMVANHLDAHVKEFRLFADVINDIGFTIDMIAPYFGRHYFLYISSAAVLCKTLCGISAGATKGSITVHFAIAGNMADLNAKESTQETMVSLTGMILGIYAAQTMQSMTNESQKQFVNWFLFITLTAIHIWANYQGVKLLRLRNINRARMNVILEPMLTSLHKIHPPDDDWSKKIQHIVLPTPDQVDERLGFYTLMQSVFGHSDPIQWGVPLTTLLRKVYNNQHQTPQQCPLDDKELFNNVDDKYVLAATTTSDTTPIRRRRRRCRYTIWISLLTGATPRDEFKAYVHAKLLLFLLTWQQQQEHPPPPLPFNMVTTSDIVGQAQRIIHDEFFNGWLLNQLRIKGWDVDGKFYFGSSRRRSQWQRHRPDTSDNDDKTSGQEGTTTETKKEK